MLKLKHIIKDVVEKHQTNESGILYRAGVKKYGKEGMRKIQQAAGKRKSHAVIGAIKDKYEKKKKESVAEALKGGGKYKSINLPKLGDEIKFKKRDPVSGMQKEAGKVYTLKRVTDGNSKIKDDPSGTKYLFVHPEAGGNRKTSFTKETWWNALKKRLITLESINEAEMVLRRKGGKTVTFTNKDNYEKAKKSGDYESPDKEKATKQDVDSDMYAQDTWDRHGGDTGKDADFQGEPPEGSREPDDVDYGGEDPEDAGEPDFYDPEDYEKLYPDKTKPKDEVGDIKYGKGFSPDSDHMFDSVAGSASSASDKYSELLDSVKSGNWKQFRSRIHDIYDEDAREHLLNLANHVDSGTYNDEFPKGKKGLKFGRKEVMDLFRQAADYGDEQFGNESITINGKKYRPIKESVKSTIFDPLTEAKKQLGGLYTRMKDK